MSVERFEWIKNELTPEEEIHTQEETAIEIKGRDRELRQNIQKEITKLNGRINAIDVIVRTKGPSIEANQYKELQEAKQILQERITKLEKGLNGDYGEVDDILHPISPN